MHRYKRVSPASLSSRAAACLHWRSPRPQHVLRTGDLANQYMSGVNSGQKGRPFAQRQVTTPSRPGARAARPGRHAGYPLIQDRYSRHGPLRAPAHRPAPGSGPGRAGPARHSGQAAALDGPARPITCSAATPLTGERLVVRVCLPGGRSDAELDAELTWLAALARDTGLTVPVARFSTRMATPGLPDGGRCIAFSWVQGRPCGSRPSRRLVADLGRVIGTLHRHARDSARRPGSPGRPWTSGT